MPKGIKLVRHFRDDSKMFEIKFSPFFGRTSTAKEYWVDIENGYYALSHSLQKDDVYDSPKRLNDELDYLKKKLAEYLNNIQTNISLSSCPYQCFERDDAGTYSFL